MNVISFGKNIMHYKLEECAGMKILLLDTTKEQIGKVIYEEIKYKIKNADLKK